MSLGKNVNYVYVTQGVDLQLSHDFVQAAL